MRHDMQYNNTLDILYTKSNRQTISGEYTNKINFIQANEA